MSIPSPPRTNNNAKTLALWHGLNGVRLGIKKSWSKITPYSLSMSFERTKDVLGSLISY